MPAATASRKRKQTDDMEESPPKRVTRARAAKSATIEVGKPSTAKKIITASTMAAAAPKATTKVTRTTKAIRHETAEDEDMVDATEVMPVKRGRGRPRKEPQTAENKDVLKVPAARGRPTKSAAEKVSGKTAPKTRTRSDTMTDTEDALAGPSGRGKRPATKTTGSKKEAAANTKPALKKKVTFEDDADLDKENVPIPKEAKKETETTSTMRAKPVRKAGGPKAATKASAARATVASSVRGSKTGKITEMGSDSAPLSPKKVTQIARSASEGSEDELCDKRPRRALRKSPVRVPQPTPQEHHPSDKHQTSSSSSSTNPAPKTSIAPFLQSPAKRPPQSPFKYAIRQSPKKVTLDAETQPTSSAESLFGNSLKASPRKVALPSHGTLAGGAPASPSKTSLLASPAKRPASPTKLVLSGSPSKPVTFSASQITPTEDTTFKLPVITPQRLFISPRSETPTDGLEFSAGIVPNEDSILLSEPPFIEGTPAKVAYTQYRENPLAAYEAQTNIWKPLVADEYRGGKSYESDDELICGTPTMALCNHPNTPQADSSRRETLGITPLATKLSGWYSSSPEKQASISDASHPDIDASAASPAPSNLVVAQFESVSPVKPSFFEEGILAVEQDAQSDNGSAGPTRLNTVGSDSNSIDHAMADASPYTARMDPKEDDDDLPAEGNLISDSQETISVHEDETECDATNGNLMDLDNEDRDFMDEAMEAHQSFGDENAIPIDPQLFAPLQEQVPASTNLGQVEPITPARSTYMRSLEVHTICKVPLRDEGSRTSPIKVVKRRRQSMSAPLDEVTCDIRSGACDLNNRTGLGQERSESPSTPAKTSIRALSESPRKISYETSVIKSMMTPRNNDKSERSSPSKSVRKGKDARILKGAIVHVDVHTSEGADASSIFIEVLSQMGAKCVRKWNWNSRASSTGTPISKPSITHVVFKDGGKRTLQKVREAKGAVMCVGVGWVLDCERENKWLDEAQYAVDTSTIPRGGHNRRKSMEPRALSNQNGSLVQGENTTKSGYELKSPDNRLSFGASSRRSSIRVSIGPDTLFEEDEIEVHDEVPSTPTPATPSTNFMGDYENGADSPTTPYYLSRGAELVQQTCPPKQIMQSLFPLSGQIEDADESLRERLLLARRKSLQWAPKVGSPLGKTVSYGR